MVLYPLHPWAKPSLFMHSYKTVKILDRNVSQLLTYPFKQLSGYKTRTTKVFYLCLDARMGKHRASFLSRPDFGTHSVVLSCRSAAPFQILGEKLKKITSCQKEVKVK